MQREVAGKYGEDGDDDAAVVSMPPPPERPTHGNAGNVPKEKKLGEKSSPKTQPGAVRVEGDDEDSAANRKANADVLKQAPAVHDSEDTPTPIVTGSVLRQAAAYHTPGVASMPTEDVKLSPSDKRGKMRAGPRAVVPGAVSENDKPAAAKSMGMDDHGLPIAQGKSEDDESVQDSKLGAVSVDNPAPRSKRGRRGGSGKAGDSQKSTAENNTTASTSRQQRNDGDKVNEEDYVVESEESDEEMEASNENLPGARRIIGSDGPSPEMEEFDLETAPTQRNLQEAPKKPEEDKIPNAIAIEEDIEYNSSEVRGSVIQAVEIDDVETEKGLKGFLLRHRRWVVFVVIFIAAAIALSFIFGLDSGGKGKNEIDSFDDVYRSSTERFQAGADFLQDRGISPKELLLSPSRSTSQYLALDWLANEDEAQVDVADENEAEFIIQRYVLAVFYFSTGGKGWLGSANFTTSSNECEWKGDRAGRSIGILSCDEDEFVTELALDGNNLTGIFPNEFGHLSMLTKVELSSNENLGGSIPETLSLLQNLESFRFKNANISGTIPDGIGDLTNLKEFQADENKLLGSIPSTVGRLTQLETWFSQFNSLSGTLPTEMGLMTSLELLFLKDNGLSGTIPSTMTALTNLRQVDVSYNQLVGGAENLCDIDGESLVKFEADCLVQLVPAISKELECECCSSCCSESSGCIGNT